MKRVFSVIFTISILFPYTLRADEGMWLLPLIKQLNINKMNETGLNLTAEDIYDINNSSLKDAVVIFGGGCTGEIVSDQGLLLTNHHCGYGQIQYHSTVENNYLEDGFWATTKDDELPNPELTATFLVRMEDVSERINAKLTDEMTENEREQTISEISSQIEEEATDGTHYDASVRPFFGGNQFYLLVYEIYKDVRLVGTPPSSIGKYGADTDNWMWPRHTGDFSVFRVYSNPDGKPAEYSEDNIPLKPRHFLPISLKGYEKDDFAMVIGYPGGTDRYMTSFEIKELLEITHPNRIKIRGLRQDILLKDMQANEKVKIQYASKYSRSSNYWKFSIGQSQGLRKLDIFGKKQKLENRFLQWVVREGNREKKYGEALSLIQDAVDARASYEHANQYIEEALYRASEIYRYAISYIGVHNMLSMENVDETEKNKKISELREEVEEHFKNYHAPTDKKVTLAMLKLFHENVPKEFHPEVLNTIEDKYKGDFNKYVDRLFDKSIFTNEESVNEFLDNPKANALQKDMAFEAALSIIQKLREIYFLLSQYNNNFDKGHRLYIAGLMQMNKDSSYYPDANFTMRLTYGTVGDYYPRDAVYYDYHTTLKGVMEKEDPNNWEFVVPEKLKELYENKDFGRYKNPDGTMPVNFTTNNDITGGNSGSPVINGDGELIGIAFDGNWEAMSGDIVFETEVQKCINVDIRYVLFIMDKFAGAKHLIDEMTIVE
jgi:hypothetical protein